MNFNAVDLSSMLTIKSISRSIAPPQENTRRSIPGMNGTLQVRKQDGDRIIEVEVAIVKTSRATLLAGIEDLAKYLVFDTEKALILPDETGRTYMAKLDGESSFKTFNIDGEGKLRFICQPYKWGALKTASPNAGTVPAPCKITVTMTGSSSSLKIALGTQFVLITTPLVNLDTVVINTLLHTVTLNGNDIRDKVSFTSDFFYLPVGAFTLVPTPAATVAVQFREMFL